MTRNSASAIAWCLKFATRIISAGCPSNGPMTSERLKTMRAAGRENRTKIKPVITARPNIPTMISSVVIRCP